MTKEETEKRIKVMQAFVDGKDVEVLNTDKWELVSNPSWSPATKYRIKPEPKYRPFNDAAECLQEMQKHQPFGWIKDKSGIGDACSVITNISYTGVYFINYSNGWKSPYRMFSDVTFFDGSPFGIKVEDEEE